MLNGCFGSTSHRFWTSNIPPKITLSSKEKKKRKKEKEIEKEELKQTGRDVNAYAHAQRATRLEGGFEYYFHHAMLKRRTKYEKTKFKAGATIHLSDHRSHGSGGDGNSSSSEESLTYYNNRFYDELMTPELEVFDKFLPMKCCLRYKFGYKSLTSDEWKKGNTLNIYKGLFFKRVSEVIYPLFLLLPLPK